MSTARLPSFPWDALADHAARARAHPDGIVDLSVGTPVDAVAEPLRTALASVSELPGYPATHGTAALRDAATDALRRRHGVTDLHPDAVLPTIGSKEFIAWLPTQLGVGPDQTVVIPELSYPTYEVGALLAGASVLRADEVPAMEADAPGLIWLNSPSNPTGRVLDVDHLRAVVEWARARGVVVASDECYLGLGWESAPVSILHPDVHGGRPDGLLAVHSLSKTSNLAGYRAGFVTGDPDLVQRLLEVRKHAGMIVPRPVQEAMTVALANDDLVTAQRERYARRREVLSGALRSAGFRIDASEAGLYLWATCGRSADDTVAWLARHGVLVAPGTFYGPRGGQHVRVALTATDERVNAAAERLTSSDS